MMDCKKPLIEADGYLHEDRDLRERGLGACQRAAFCNQGGNAYIHFKNRRFLVEGIANVLCRQHAGVPSLVKDSRSIASPASPTFRSRDDVPSSARDKRRIAEAQAAKGKPDNAFLESSRQNRGVIQGSLPSPAVREVDSRTVQQLLDDTSARVGEKVAVRRFVRYKLGEATEAETE